VCSSGIPADADGILTLIGTVNDVSEGGDDIIVAAVNLETLTPAANQWFEAALAAETVEFQNTLEPGDTLRFTLTSDSAGIETNPEVNVIVEWHPVPDHEDLNRIQHPSDYLA
jgi:hypothetical protein